jgi:hypothetical protein
MANLRTNKITRDKLAKIFGNQEAIKLIENLVSDVSVALPDSITTTDTSAAAAAAAAQSTANTALATANAALALGGGGGGSLVVFQAEDADVEMPMLGFPGGAGLAGPVGPAGQIIFMEAPEPDEPLMIPGPKGDTGASGGGGGSATIKATTITVPYGANKYEASVVDASVLVTSNILISHGAYADTDTNEPEDDLATFYVSKVVAGGFNIEISAPNQQTLGGPFKFNYLIG